MSKPFAQLMLERCKLPGDVVAREAYSRIAKWSVMSSGKLVSLDEVVWFAAVLHLATEKLKEDHERAQAKAQMERKVAASQGGKIHSVTLSDGASTQDGVG